MRMCHTLFFSVCMVTALATFIGCSNEVDVLSTDMDRVNRNEPQTEAMKISGEMKTLSADEVQKVAQLFNPDEVFRTDKTKSRAAVEAKTVKDIVAVADSLNDPLLYIVNYADRKGWVIISATKKHYPILAYSDEGSFDKDGGSPANIWLSLMAKDVNHKKYDETAVKKSEWKKYEQEPSILVTKSDIPSYQTIQWWQDETIHDIRHTDNYPPRLSDYSSYGTFDGDTFCNLNGITSYFPNMYGTFSSLSQQMANMGWDDSAPLFHLKSFYKRDIVDPLLTTYWHQDFPYNNNVPNQYPAGCVPIALGQIMNYHQFPANYANWSNMGTDSEKATFIKKIGDDIDMIYTQNKSYPNFWEYLFEVVPVGVFIDFSDLTGIRNFFEDNNYSIAKGKVEDNLPAIKAALMAGKPVYMEGTGESFSVLGITFPNFKAHAWVCDGLRATTFTNCLEYLYLPTYPNPGPYYDTPLATNPYERDYYTIGGYLESNEIYSYYHMNWGWDEHPDYNTNDDSYTTANGWFLDAYTAAIPDLEFDVWHTYVIPTPNN